MRRLAEQLYAESRSKLLEQIGSVASMKHYIREITYDRSNGQRNSLDNDIGALIRELRRKHPHLAPKLANEANGRPQLGKGFFGETEAEAVRKAAEAVDASEFES
jgi:hypothetical protein